MTGKIASTRNQAGQARTAKTKLRENCVRKGMIEVNRLIIERKKERKHKGSALHATWLQAV
ncbi:MAG: hypothetical protein HHJ09_16560 [Glaciimonas sp.]|nr:hypothetical protein [Glaciimonas sp.]